jgi:hypothetical protein
MTTEEKFVYLIMRGWEQLPKIYDGTIWSNRQRRIWLVSLNAALKSEGIDDVQE